MNPLLRLDPLNRVVTVIGYGEDCTGPYVEVRLAGSYGATVRYAPSMLRPVGEEA